MRADLQALTPETLAELANRGLVKRASREIERSVPAIVEDGEATVHATFDDGVTTTLPVGGLDRGTCSCGATGVCRHVVGLVLAYRRTTDAPPADSAAPTDRPDRRSRDQPGRPAREDEPGQADHPGDTDRTTHPGPAGQVDQLRPADLPGHGDQPHHPNYVDLPGSADRSSDPTRADDSDRSSGPDRPRRRLPSPAVAVGVGPDDAAGVRPPNTAAAPIAEPGHAALAPAGRSEWSPGEFTDVQLGERIGARMMAAARRMERTGYIARVHRARPGDPVSSVELPTTTVRFLVPRDLSFARTDAAAGVRDDVLALAVWAFREADARSPDEADVQVQVGGGRAATSGPGLEAAVALAGVVLREGAVHLGAGIAADLIGVRRALEAGRMRWPLLAVDDLVVQLEAYRDRSARYRPEALADHVAELFARHRTVTDTDTDTDPEAGAEAAAGGRALPGPTSQRALRSRVLGTDEASETPLRRARLDGLGARVSVVGDERVVEVFLAHATSATVLVLRRSYETTDSGPQLGARRVAGVSVGSLAGGAVVTESATRSASRAVRLSTRRLSRTEAMTSRGSWQDLPRALLADDLALLARELDALPPRLVRPRVEAELVRVVPVADVRSVSYLPGAQRLDAVIADAAGVTAVVSAVHAACAPGRLDSMAAALSGNLRYVAGSVRRAGGGIVIDPIGFALDDAVVVPDLAAADRGTEPDDAPVRTTDALGLALDEAATLLAELAHGGLHHALATVPGRLRAAAARLRKVGLHRVAETMVNLAGRLGPDPGDAATEAWVDAYLYVNLAADMR